MPKSKEQAELEILTEVQDDNNPNWQINERHLDSSHPIDCKCPICNPFTDKEIMSSQDEKERRAELDYPLN